ncbi:MAG: DUF3341 domain-containing protein [Cytophagaceae bacterium]|nr:DUF3341 domain-containing protein [Cytophagaceae bacterium]MDW8455618.1 DUF3341 domain-containing protein [Cytophagaceae bacterium]
MEKGKNFILGVFDDEDILLEGVHKVRKAGVNIHEVYTPFPVHGLDTALGYKYSNLPVASFIYGMIGTISALSTMIWMLGFDWPMDIGGKGHIPLPDFIPITFEFTVLLAAHGMVLTFFIVSNLWPWNYKPKMFDPRSTDDKFVMAIDLAKNTNIKIEELEKILKDSGAVEVNKKDMN